MFKPQEHTHLETHRTWKPDGQVVIYNEERTYFQLGNHIWVNRIDNFLYPCGLHRATATKATYFLCPSHYEEARNNVAERYEELLPWCTKNE